MILCGVVCVKLSHSSLGHREDVFTTHLIIIIKSEASSFPKLLSYFSVVVCLRWLYHHMLSASYISRESWVLFLLLLCSLIMCANNRVHYGLIALICLHITLPHYHNHADISEVGMLIRYILLNVCLRFSSLKYLSCNKWGCVYSAYPFLV